MGQPLLTLFKRQGRTPRRVSSGKPWKNGRKERLEGTFRRECLEAERVHSLLEDRVVLESWRRYDNQDRLHRALHDRTPAIASCGGR